MIMNMTMKPWRSGVTAITIATATLISACAPLRVVGPDYAGPEPAKAVAGKWQAALPHGANNGSLRDWWQQLNDPVLVTLVDAAQKESATVVQAQARVTQARGTLIAAGAAVQPITDLSTGTNRSALSFGGPVFLRTLSQVQVQSSWEIDLFGGNRRDREAAQARVDARQADWHDARVAIAAETASNYLQLRFCELQVALLESDLASRRETARLTDLSAKAGFQAPANAALTQAGASDTASRLINQRTDCDVLIKALVALTALDEPALRTQLASKRATLPLPASFDIVAVPAQLLTQRPDLAAAERDLAAASADIGSAEATRYPKLSLTGSITPFIASSAGQTLRSVTWSIGPTLSLPLYDGGRRVANLETAKANYQSAEAAFRSKARNAVREVEEALLRLASANERQADTKAAADGYRSNLEATSSRFRVGLGSALEQEESRRLSLTADANLIALQRDRVSSWITLYRAMGGGWTVASN